MYVCSTVYYVSTIFILIYYLYPSIVSYCFCAYLIFTNSIASAAILQKQLVNNSMECNINTSFVIDC